MELTDSSARDRYYKYRERAEEIASGHGLEGRELRIFRDVSGKLYQYELSRTGDEEYERQRNLNDLNAALRLAISGDSTAVLAAIRALGEELFSETRSTEGEA